MPAEGALCAYHATHAQPVTPSPSFESGPHSTDHLSPEEREALALATLLPQPSSEIAILRVLILHAAARCDLDFARRGMETLGRLLKIQHDIDPLRLREEPLEDGLVPWVKAIVAGK